MSSIVISGDTSGTVAIAAPAIAGTNTMTLAAGTGTLAPKVLSTAVASTSGTSIDFTNIPSWVTRITVMLYNVSGSGTSPFLIQAGTSGGIQTSGYNGYTWTAATDYQTTTAGVRLQSTVVAAQSNLTAATFVNVTGNLWIASGITTITAVGTSLASIYAYSFTTSSTLNQIRLTTISGTDTFDAGSVNIMYE